MMFDIKLTKGFLKGLQLEFLFLLSTGLNLNNGLFEQFGVPYHAKKKNPPGLEYR